jgi:hypothetical protein
MMDELEIRIELERLVTIREQMIIENLENIHHGAPPSNLPEQFKELAKKMQELSTLYKQSKKNFSKIGDFF